MRSARTTYGAFDGDDTDGSKKRSAVGNSANAPQGLKRRSRTRAVVRRRRPQGSTAAGSTSAHPRASTSLGLTGILNP